MSDNKMFNKMASTPWKLVELPGGHNWSIIEEESDIHLANVGDDRTSDKAGYLPGNAILKNAEAIVSAVNSTWGSGINPEAVPELFKILVEIFHSPRGVGLPVDLVNKMQKAIDKSKL
jgi:hypothetical protein